MKTHLSSVLLAALVTSCCSQTGTPNQNNPSTRELPPQAFTVTVIDRQPGIVEDSTYFFYGDVKSDCRDGVVNYDRGRTSGSGYEFHYTPDPVKLIQTGYNHIFFETSAPVNVSSSDACLDIVRTDDTHFEIRHFSDHTPDDLTGIREGSTDIRFWNGSGDNEKSITIRVDAQSSVKCEGFEFRIDGKQYLLTEIPFEDFKYVKFGDWDKWPQYQYKEKLKFAGRENPDWSKTGLEAIEEVYYTSCGYCFELVGTIPRNATPDNRVRRLVDVVSMKTAGNLSTIDHSFAPFYIWNEAQYQGFRWLPKNDSSVESVISKSASTQFYPADLRYRKAWIWNRTLKDDEQSSYVMNQYFCFFFYEGDRERNFIGCLKEK